MKKMMLMAGLLALAGCDELLGEDIVLSESELNLCDDSAPSDDIDIAAAEIVGSSLELEVGYGGGCEAHQVAVCWDGSVAESYPGQVWLWVSHDGNGDSCEAYESETLSVNLSELGEGPLTVHLDGWDGSLSLE